MTKLTVDVGGCHVLIEDPDGRVIRVLFGDLDQLAEQVTAIEPTTPGARRRDREGDVWTRRDDGRWQFAHISADSMTWADLRDAYGPLYPVAVPE